MKNGSMAQLKDILLLLFFLTFLIPGCQCTSFSCGGGRENKKNIYNSGNGNDSIQAPSYQVERGGRLFVTGEEIYYVRDGKIAWQSSPAKKYHKLYRRYYVATGDYVFCSLVDGTVLWKTRLVNSGSCEVRDGVLYVLTSQGEKKLNLKSGEGIL